MKNRLFFSFVVCVFVLTVIFASCNNPSGGGTYTVRYEITGPQAVADLVLYTNESGNIDQITNIAIPWTKTVNIQGLITTVSCGANIYSANVTTYTAKIFLNGREIANASSSSGSLTAVGVIR